MEYAPLDFVTLNQKEIDGNLTGFPIDERCCNISSKIRW